MSDQSIYARPDEFSLNPFIAVLPVIGQINKLQSLSNALFVKYEKVHAALQGLEEDVLNPEHRKRLAAEEAMLRLSLEWLGTDVQGAEG